MGARAAWAGWLVPVTGGLVAVLVTVVLWQAMARAEWRNLRSYTAQSFEHVEETIVRALHDRLGAVQRVAEQLSFSAALPGRPEWERAVEIALRDSPEFFGMALIDRERVFISAVARLDYAPLIGQRADFDDVRRAVMDRVDATGRIQTTPGIEFRLGGYGFLAIAPVVTEGDLNGYVLAAIDTEQLLEIALLNVAPGFALRIQDQERELFSRGARGNARESLTRDLTFQSGTWSVELWPGPEIVARDITRLPDIVLMLGLAASVLLFTSMRLAAVAQQKARAAEAAHDLNRAVLASLTAAIGVVDKRGRVTALNAAWEDMPPVGDLEALVAEIRDGKSTRIEREYRDGDRWWQLRAVPLRDETGEGAVVAHDDITARKTAEQRVAEREERFRMVIQQTGQLVYDCDLMNSRIVWTGAARAVTGFGTDELESRSWRELIDPADLPGYEAAVDSAMAHGGTYALRYRIHRKDGSVIHVDDRGVVLLGDDGKPARELGAVSDASERVRVEQERKHRARELKRQVAKRTRELAQSNTELEAFSYSVSHDLRTPLRAISGFADILRDEYAESLDDEGRHCVQRILEGSERMGRLIDDLLALARVSRATLVPEDIDLALIARTVAGRLADTDPQRRVEWDIPDSLPARGDPRLVEVLLENLLGNAWKFTARRDEAHIAVGHRDGAWFVRDDGVGVDMRYADKLFGLFQRLHNVEEFPGTGVGLATVHRIVERHGGLIWCESVVGEGACFRFTLAGAV